MPPANCTSHPFYPNIKIPQQEEWRDIEGFEGIYQVSSLGRVKSLKRKIWNGNSFWWRDGQLLKPSRIGRDDWQPFAIPLWKGNKGRTRLVHHLVLEAFICKRPSKLLFGCHYDCDTSNNKLENLRWDTQEENTRDSVREGTIKHGEDHHNAKLTVDKVREIRRLYAAGTHSQKDLSQLFHIDQGHISSIISRKKWRRVQ